MKKNKPEKYKQIKFLNVVFGMVLILGTFIPVKAYGQGMPQLYLTYEGELSSTMESYIDASMILTDEEGREYKIDNTLIKTRGATAKEYYNKPSLNLKLRTADGEELDTDLLGLRKASTFILDAMAIDRINMRNRVCFDIWNSFSRLPYATDFGSRNGTVGKFVEVYLNGKYKGIYCLTDKINRKLLDLKKPEVDSNGGVTIRGVLYKNGTNDIEDQNNPGYFNNYLDYVAAYHDAWELHEPEEYASKAVWAPLADLYAENHFSNYQYVKDHFYLENLADYTIHILALCIEDNWGTKNRYFSIQNITKDDDRSKFVVTPWDLDASLGGNYNGEKYNGNYTEWDMNDIMKNAPIPITACINQPEFKALLKKRWIEGSLGAFAVDSVKQRLENYADLFIESGAWQRTIDANNWMDLIVKDLKTEIRMIGEWYEKRFREMDAYFGVSDADRAEAAGIDLTVVGNDHNDTIYNLQGIRVKDTNLPGVYIINGQKVLVRK